MKFHVETKMMAAAVLGMTIHCIAGSNEAGSIFISQ